VIRDAGDSALVFELEPRVDAGVNARAVAMADAVRAAAIPGVRDVVSTYRSVAVFFDPLQTRLEAVTRALESAAGQPPPARETARVDVPVVYGGEHGPDLAGVAAHTSLTEAEVVGRHASQPYRVFMLGFVPGFAYMGIVDESIAVPRRATPRVRVPAGSVAIAGRQTGVYPQETPGGWHLLGRTRTRMFDVDRSPQFLVRAGDEVRFVPVKSVEETGPALRPGSGQAPRARNGQSPSAERPGTPRAGLTVLAPGLLSTIQDLGRWGYQDRGVPVAGPMDPVSHRLANAAAGNPADAATIEITLLGPELRFEQPAVFAIAGADLGARVGERAIACGTPAHARAGDVLRFANRVRGARAYLAVSGGILTGQVMGSRATHLVSAMGGVAGRALVAGDRLPLAPVADQGGGRSGAIRADSGAGRVRLRVLPGPQDDFFEAAAFDRLQSGTFRVSPQSNRMAYRLTSATVPRASDREMISDATVFGGIQVPPSGEPILLMADRQTSGGYPQIATVITADLPLAGQLAPGDEVEFAICTRREALAALISQEGMLLARR
jgi:KipI family sensor histidine kinase inhibitor